MTEPRDYELRDALWQASGDDCDTGNALLAVEARGASHPPAPHGCRRRRAARRTRRHARHRVPDRGQLARPSGDPHDGGTAHDRGADADHGAGARRDRSPCRLVGRRGRGRRRTAAPDPASVAADGTAVDTAVGETAADGTAAADSAAGDDPAQEAASPATDPRPAGAVSPVRAQQTFKPAGGQLTVGVANGALTIVAATPSDGFTVEPATTSDARVEVVFRSQVGRSWIRVDLVNGHLRPTLSDGGGRTGDGHGPTRTTSPTTTAGGGDHGSGHDGRPGRTGDSSSRG